MKKDSKKDFVNVVKVDICLAVNHLCKLSFS